MSTTTPNTRSSRLRQGVMVLTAAVIASATIPGCGVAYVVRSAYFQAELLHSREPIADLRERQFFNETELKALDRINDVKAFGAEIGLEATENYGTYAMDWDRTIWNLSACEELAFTPRRWTFPIVGRVPYLGFFRREDAEPWIQRLEADGYETYLRTAGAYSTLGWFRDPVLPSMMKWNDYRLADTVLHELAHATVWIKGSVKFNESFASFVGEVGAFQYLSNRFGPESEQLRRAREDHEDVVTWRAVLRALYTDLDAVFRDESLSDSAKRSAKAVLFASLPDRVEAAGFHRPERFLRAARDGKWNNARLVQFKTYNHNRDHFEALFKRENDDLLAFMRAVQVATRDHDDPFQALRDAAKK